MKSVVKYLVCFLSAFIVALLAIFLIDREVDYSGAFIAALFSTIALYAGLKVKN